MISPSESGLHATALASGAYRNVGETIGCVPRVRAATRAGTPRMLPLAPMPEASSKGNCAASVAKSPSRIAAKVPVGMPRWSDDPAGSKPITRT